jgi:hypothetical protein
MMTLAQFEQALWGLKLLDMQELVDAGAIDDRDYQAWDRFSADRVTWLLMNPARAPAVWQAIWRHRPKQPHNVIPLPQKPAGKRNAR